MSWFKKKTKEHTVSLSFLDKHYVLQQGDTFIPNYDIVIDGGAYVAGNIKVYSPSITVASID